MSTKKRHGHYCKICGQRKSNESFSGKGHRTHICKVCSRLSAKEKAEQMTLTRLAGMEMRYLTEAEIKWLKNRTHDPRQEVRELACEIFEEHFPQRGRTKQEDMV